LTVCSSNCLFWNNNNNNSNLYDEKKTWFTNNNIYIITVPKILTKILKIQQIIKIKF